MKFEVVSTDSSTQNKDRIVCSEEAAGTSGNIEMDFACRIIKLPKAGKVKA